MKKLLLGTTALIGAVALFAGAAHAENPKVTLGGFATFEGAIANDDQDSAQRSQSFRSDTEISVHVDGKTDAGLGYGAVVDLEADTTEDADNQGVNASRTYVYLDGGWGRVEMGSTEGPEDTLKVDASSIARATGGIDGDWTYFANSSAQFIATPDLFLAYGSGNLGNESTNNVNKVIYYSPRFSGFQVGVAYAPDSTDRGQTTTRTDTTAGQAGDIILAALNYQGQFDQVSVAGSLTGEWGDSDSSARQDLAAWAIGGKVGYAGFSLAGSYGDWDDSLRTAGNIDDNNYWTVGAAYETGPFGVSVTYLNSEYAASSTTSNDFDNVVVGADYKLAEGLTPFIEVSFYDQDATGTVNDNQGTVGLLGVDLAF